ncbi:hypothetical protein AAFF_G00115190 [Aldrovandia affinis]|uniref:Reverse transcriptase domain-containing protein n=1 Tax=Aldrovandia affinis TaxID=143900 RepID=A0AAD7R384_9TELE|nr:hypothetical protein AAFF_G00115190 [Aldrovandia affinis]
MATTAALSAAYTFSHTPRPSGRGGGTGILISPLWRFGIVPLPHFSPSSFEFHAVTVTVPCKLHIIVLYRPPGPLGNFLDEMDALLSSFPEDGTPVLLLGDLNLPLETSQASAFLPLLQSFDFTVAESPSTHKASNQLDLVFTRNCASPNITNDLLDPNQSGFRAGHSTETALLAFTEALHGAKSRSLSSVLLLLDLSAAFDTVDHRILLSSLVEMGISGSALTWFESYLADRSYQVAWRGSLSSPHTLSTGVRRARC